MERRSLQLTAKQWTYLEDLAETHEALARGGPRTGKPSWRVLARMIADGELLLMTEDEMAATRQAMKGVKTLVEAEAEKPTPRVVYKSPP